MNLTPDDRRLEYTSQFEPDIELLGIRATIWGCLCVRDLDLQVTRPEH